MGSFTNKLITPVLLLVLLLAAACGRDRVPDMGWETLDSLLERDSYMGEAMSVSWGFYNPVSTKNTLEPGESRIAEELNARFNVEITSEKYAVSNRSAHQRHSMERNDLPDIFIAQLDYDELRESGAIRAIPREMIRRYAPRYAAMLEQDKKMAELYEKEEYAEYALFGLEKKTDALQTFSGYRLDWLEEIGILPRGQVWEISEGLYFTDTAFNISEFMEIMQGFSYRVGGGWGFSLIGDERDWFYAEPLLGMWGLVPSNVNVNGYAVGWYVTEGFRSYLEFLEQMINQGLIYRGHDFEHNIISGADGWASEHLFVIFGEEYDIIKDYLPRIPGAKILFTPPEIGPEGHQGVHQSYASEGLSVHQDVYFIGAGVSDEKLARILEIYEALSFDPELYVMSHYGFEGDDFNWMGEPFLSPIEKNPENREWTKIFISNVLDEEAGKRLYRFPSLELYQFADSPQGRSMVLKPFKSDPEEIFKTDLEALEAAFPSEALLSIAAGYYRAVMSGEKEVASTWEDYLDMMYENGQTQWNAYYDTLPVTG